MARAIVDPDVPAAGLPAVMPPGVTAWATEGLNMGGELQAPSIDIVAALDVIVASSRFYQGTSPKLTARTRFDAFTLIMAAMQEGERTAGVGDLQNGVELKEIERFPHRAICKEGGSTMFASRTLRLAAGDAAVGVYVYVLAVCRD